MKSFLKILSILMIGSVAQAQNVQEKSVWTSAPPKIDGKTPEESFQATNKSTMLSYTMSNDDKNLYLVIKSEDNMNNNKIMMGGITFTINTDGKKKEKDAYQLTYPVIARQQGQRAQGSSGQRQQGGFGQRQQTSNTDSVMLARRKQQLAAVKEIAVSGFKEITDSLISIYNEYDILAAANFDDKGSFVCELAIPLRHLNLDKKSEFTYNLKVNGRQFGGFGGFGGGEGRPMVVVREGGGFGGGAGGGRGGFDPSMFLPTDFWAKYTLAKK